MRIGYQKDICTSFFIVELFTITKIWKIPKCPSVYEWIKNCTVYIHKGTIFSHEKEGYPAICDNMDGLWIPYGKWDEWTRKKQVLSDIT